VDVDEVDPTGSRDLRNRGDPVELSEAADRQPDPNDAGPCAHELEAFGAGTIGGDHGLPEASRVEGLGQAGGVDLHATDRVEAPGPQERLGRGLVDGAEPQDSHVVLPGHADHRVMDVSIGCAAAR
jgi:hypothetical protein